MNRYNKNILLSEDHHLSQQNIERINSVSDYLYKLVEHENAGLLEHELFFTVNDKVRGTTSQCYSTHQRCCEWNGILYAFEDPETIQHCMQQMIDQFNYKFWTLKHCKHYIHDITRLLSQLTIDFLHIHPFGDGNGRTIKCMINYILHSLHYPSIDFSNISYTDWCKIIVHQFN